MAKLVAVDELSPHPRLGSTELLPSLTEEEYAALRDSIAESGIKQPLVVAWPEKVILDGHHRWKAARDLGLDDVPVMTEEFASEDAQLRLGVTLNVARRQLSREQKRAAIAALLKDDPKQSNRSVAKTVGADHKTVGSVREDMEATGEVPQLDTRVGQDGRERPATKPNRTIPDLPTKKDGSIDKLGAMRAAREAEAGSGNGAPPAPKTPKPDPSREEQERTSRSNGYAHIGKLCYFADMIRSEANIESSAALIAEHPEEFYADQRFSVDQVIEAAEVVTDHLPRFIEALKSKMEDAHVAA